MNRLLYDQCAYSQAVTQSVSPLSYVLDPTKYEHNDKCRVELGVVGGTAVSHVTGNLVDLENNLLGIDRPGLQCDAFMWRPQEPGAPIQGHEYVKPVCHPKIDTTMKHLQKCQLSSYQGVPMPPSGKAYSCSS